MGIRKLGLLVLPLAFAGLACDGGQLEGGDDEAEVSAIQPGESLVPCSRTFIRRSTGMAASLTLLPDALSFELGETLDLRANTPPAAHDCRLSLSEAMTGLATGSR